MTGAANMRARAPAVLAAQMYWWGWKFLPWIYFVQLFKIYLCLHHLSFGKFANHVCVTVTERCLMIGAANMAAPTLFQILTIF